MKWMEVYRDRYSSTEIMYMGPTCDSLVKYIEYTDYSLSKNYNASVSMCRVTPDMAEKIMSSISDIRN